LVGFPESRKQTQKTDFFESLSVIKNRDMATKPVALTKFYEGMWKNRMKKARVISHEEAMQLRPDSINELPVVYNGTHEVARRNVEEFNLAAKQRFQLRDPHICYVHKTFCKNSKDRSCCICEHYMPCNNCRRLRQQLSSSKSWTPTKNSMNLSLSDFSSLESSVYTEPASGSPREGLLHLPL
jgi:hypothetical protein